MYLFAHPREPAMQCGETWRVWTETVDNLAQPRAHFVRRDISADGLFDDGEAERLVREQFRRQDSRKSLTCGASGKRDAQGSVLRLAVLAGQYGTSLRPASAERERPAGPAVTTTQHGR